MKLPFKASIVSKYFWDWGNAGFGYYNSKVSDLQFTFQSYFEVSSNTQRLRAYS